MRYTHTTVIGKYEHTFCVVYSDNMWSEPVRVSHYWPIIEQDLIREQDIGKPARDAGGGVYSYRLGEQSFSGWVSVHLRNGSATKPIHTEEHPLPKPKLRVETRYSDARWQKLLQSKGWVNI